MYVRYSESARILWFKNFASHIDPQHRRQWEELWTPKGYGLILKSIKVDYKFVSLLSPSRPPRANPCLLSNLPLLARYINCPPQPMVFPDRISVFHKLRSCPDQSTESFILDVVILSELHRRVAARTTEDLLVYDYKKGQKVALPPFMVEKFQETFKLQEGAKQRNSARVKGLIERVRQLETGSWDRADAKEDLGSAGKS